MSNELKQQFAEITLIKIFEVEVVNNKTQEKDWITFNIDANDEGLYAIPSEDLTEETEKIVPIIVEWDDTFTLDHHLETLYEYCNGAIMESVDWDLFFE